MSVGKDSILRVANADAKKTEVKVETKPATGEGICEGRAAGNSEWSGSYQRRTSDLSSVIRSTFLSEFAGWIF